MPSVQRLLDERVAAAMRAAFPEAADLPAIVVPAQDPRFGDYQANGAMALAKRLKRKPREVAEAVLARLDVSDLAEPPEIAGPGFINIRLRPDWVAGEIGKVNRIEPDQPEDRLGVPRAERPETVVVDYSAPNLAKEMHVGHLRSTIIGDALVRMLEFVSHRVIRQNHVGDWGTQVGMLVAYLDHALDEGSLAPANVIKDMLKDLEDNYRKAKALFDTNEAFANAARDEVVRLQSGDQETVGVWKTWRKLSLYHCQQVYGKLGVGLGDGDIRGESAYNDDLPKVLEDLRAKGLLTESEGAQCVFLNDADRKPLFVAKDGSPLPLIVQKSDEGYLYATTDLAAIRYRVNELHANRILYVVDARQSLHFQMLFACARKAGFAPPDVELVHVAFGTMMGPDGRPFKTREGGTVKLMDLLDEAEKRAYELVSAKSPDLPETEKRDIAHKVGIGAVKYADLAQSRTSDYVFSWEKMLSLDGNTAPYMQYAYARVRSIFRKGGHEAEEHRQDAAPIAVEAPAEIALAKMILRFPEALDRTLEDYRPNVLAAYLYDLAQAFTAFYDACPVIQSEGPTRANRLKLCDLTARVIARGLGLLGIETAERM
ncbi:MAG: arginine--tRNA ligase [Planctomycetota bacterium]|nr:arginine--tRNA ligase [Planctomycetota bacterium]